MKPNRWMLPAALLCVLSALSAPALADRPFVATTSAAAEEDDDRVWSISTWAQRDKRLTELGVSAEYAFEPRLSTEFTLSRTRPRLGGESSLQAEAEVKWLYNNIARDGWGVGVALALGAGKEGDASWRGGNWAVTVPFSWQWSASGGLLHLNVGVERERGSERENFSSVAVEVPIVRQFTGFAELARQGDERLAHAGVRWWIKQERFALDFSALRRKPQGESAVTGWVLNFSVYDL